VCAVFGRIVINLAEVDVRLAGITEISLASANVHHVIISIAAQSMRKLCVQSSQFLNYVASHPADDLWSIRFVPVNKAVPRSREVIGAVETVCKRGHPASGLAGNA